jgi:outer membrane lipoprotein-sorting protein
MKQVVALLLLALLLLTLISGCTERADESPETEDEVETEEEEEEEDGYPDTSGRPLVREGTGSR